LLVHVAEEAADPRRSLLSVPFAAVTAATFVFFTYVGVLVPLVPTYIEDELRGGELGVGLAIASFAGVAIAVRPLIGRLIARYGRRAVMIGGALLAAASGSLYGFVDSLPALLVLRGLTGAGEAGLFVAAMTLVIDLSPPDRRAEAASYFSVAVFGGLGIGPIVGEAIMHGSGFRVAFVVGGVLAVAAAIVSITTPGHAVAEVVDRQPAVRGGWLHPSAVGPGVVLASGMAAFAVLSAFLPDHAHALGMSGSAGLFAVYSAVCLVLRVAGARVPERLGPRTAVTMALITLGLGMTMLAAVDHAWALWAAAVTVGVGMAFMYPSLMAFTVDHTPDVERPQAIASFTMFFEAGTAVGGLALGALADVFGKRSGFAAAVVLCAIGLWLLRNVVIPAERRDHAPLVAATAD
jgi:MFS family permease